MRREAELVMNTPVADQAVLSTAQPAVEVPADGT